MAETDSWLDLLHRLGHLSDDEELALHHECLWIMESLKSKILDLDRYDQQKRGSIRETNAPYIVGNTATMAAEPVWPFVEDDYL